MIGYNPDYGVGLFCLLQGGHGGMHNISTNELQIPSQWTHIAIAWDATNLCMYVNGDSLKSLPLSANVDMGTADWMLGVSEDPFAHDQDGPFDMAEFAVYPYKLTALQVRTVFRYGVHGAPAGTVILVK